MLLKETCLCRTLHYNHTCTVLYTRYGTLRIGWIIYSFRKIYCESKSVFDFYWEFNKGKYMDIVIFKELLKKSICFLESTWKSIKIDWYIHCSLHLSPQWQDSQQRMVYLIFRNHKMFPLPLLLIALALYHSIFIQTEQIFQVFIVLLLQVSKCTYEHDWNSVYFSNTNMKAPRTTSVGCWSCARNGWTGRHFITSSE